MATTQDITELKAQFDERITHLRESFGVVETDVTRLGQFGHEFSFASLDQHQHDDNDLKTLGKEVHDKAQSFVALAHGDLTLVQGHFHTLQTLFADAPAQMDAHVEQHTAGHQALQDATHTMSGSVEQVAGEVDQAHNDYLQHVQDMHTTLSSLADKVFGSATQLDHSVRDTQAAALEKASSEFHALVDQHVQSHIPSTFQDAVGQLTQHVHDLGSHATTAGENLQNELTTLIHDLSQYAAQEVHDKIEQKFNQLLHDTLTFITQELADTAIVFTGGVGVTGALSPILPELAVLKHVLDALKEAIKIFKALEEIF